MFSLSLHWSNNLSNNWTISQLIAVSKAIRRSRAEKHMHKLLLRKRWINLDSLKPTIEFSSRRLCNSIKTRESNNVRCKDSQEWMSRQWIVTMLCKQLRERQVSSRVQISRGTIQQTNSIYRFRHRRQPMLKEARKRETRSIIRAFRISWVAPVRKTFQIVRS